MTVRSCTRSQPHGGRRRAAIALFARQAEPPATRRRDRCHEVLTKLFMWRGSAIARAGCKFISLTWHGCAVRCRCRSLPPGERCAHTSPATHQPSPENSRDFLVLGAAVSQVWPAELARASTSTTHPADAEPSVLLLPMLAPPAPSAPPLLRTPPPPRSPTPSPPPSLPPGPPTQPPPRPPTPGWPLLPS